MVMEKYSQKFAKIGYQISDGDLTPGGVVVPGTGGNLVFQRTSDGGTVVFKRDTVRAFAKQDSEAAVYGIPVDDIKKHNFRGTDVHLIDVAPEELRKLDNCLNYSGPRDDFRSQVRERYEQFTQEGNASKWNGHRIESQKVPENSKEVTINGRGYKIVSERDEKERNSIHVIAIPTDQIYRDTHTRVAWNDSPLLYHGAGLPVIANSNEYGFRAHIRGPVPVEDMSELDFAIMRTIDSVANKESVVYAPAGNIVKGREIEILDEQGGFTREYVTYTDPQGRGTILRLDGSKLDADRGVIVENMIPSQDYNLMVDSSERLIAIPSRRLKVVKDQKATINLEERLAA